MKKVQYGPLELNIIEDEDIVENDHSKAVKALFPVGAKVSAHDSKTDEYYSAIVIKHGINWLEVKWVSGRHDTPTCMYGLHDIKASRKLDEDSLVWLGW